MAKRNRPFTIYNYMRMPDGSDLLFCMIENRGTPEQKVTYYVSEEERAEFSRRMMKNVGSVMSDYYAQKEARGELSDCM